MNGDRPSVKAIFLLARGVPGPEQRRVVAEACGADAALAAQVMELLAVDAGLVDGEDDAAVDRLVGRRLGDYLVRERIGSGGMGVVYAAEQQQPRRTVALKVLRSFATAVPVLRRFRNESELLARLTHPNIAQVFAAGASPIDGQEVPYIAMEFVAGARIVTEFAERENLALADRVRLLATACEAVEHGHRKGVIHRDLKPDNILVAADGTVKLIDFGVARVVDTATVLSTVQTLPGQLIGTLQYMCPEQCTGVPDDLDVRGDVYSLGVVLYELVAGHPPIDLRDATWVTAIHRIRTEMPPPARHWQPSLPRKLDVILGKALAKDREDRYSSAAALGDDLRAFLAGRPIAAQRPSAWLRMVGWIGRHPLAATAAACGGLIAVVVLALWALARHYAIVPDRVAIDSSQRAVQLLSRTGRKLYAWPSRARIDQAILVPGDAVRGPLVVIAYGGGVAEEPRSGHAAAYDASAPSPEPVWTTAVELESFEAVRQRNPQQYYTTRVLFAEDLLIEVPGTEVAVVQYLRTGDYTSVRIFDARGALRFCTYHVGVVDSGMRVPNSGRIILAGFNSMHTWQQLGAAAFVWPAVVLAIDVRDGHRGPTEGLVRDRSLVDPTVAWYSWFGPPEHFGSNTALHLSPNPALGVPGAVADIVVGAEQDSQTVSVLSVFLDADGNEVHRYPYDSYKIGRTRGLPPLLEARFLPLADLPRPR